MGPSTQNQRSQNTPTDRKHLEDEIRALSVSKGVFDGLEKMYTKLWLRLEQESGKDKKALSERRDSIATAKKKVESSEKRINELKGEGKTRDRRKRELNEMIQIWVAERDRLKGDQKDMQRKEEEFKSHKRKDQGDARKRNWEDMQNVKEKIKRSDGVIAGKREELAEIEAAREQFTRDENDLKEEKATVRQLQKEIDGLQEKTARDEKIKAECGKLLPTHKEREMNSQDLRTKEQALLGLQQRQKMDDEKFLQKEITNQRSDKVRLDRLTSELQLMCDGLIKWKKLMVNNKRDAWDKLSDVIRDLKGLR